MHRGILEEHERATLSELATPSAVKLSSAGARADKLPLPTKVSYAAGQLVELVVGSMLNVFVLFYVTAVCGLPGWLAGIALGAGLVVDAAMEPLIGSLTDGWRSRYGRRVPFMVAGLVPIVVTFNLIFALPTGIGDIALFLWLMLLSVSLRISLSIYTLPYQALGAELSDDYAERSSIAAWRWGIGILGTVAVIALGYGVFLEGPDGLSHRESYLPLTLSLSLILVAGALIAIRTGLVTRHRQHETVAPSAAIHAAPVRRGRRSVPQQNVPHPVRLDVAVQHFRRCQPGAGPASRHVLLAAQLGSAAGAGIDGRDGSRAGCAAGWTAGVADRKAHDADYRQERHVRLQRRARDA